MDIWIFLRFEIFCLECEGYTYVCFVQYCMYGKHFSTYSKIVTLCLMKVKIMFNKNQKYFVVWSVNLGYIFDHILTYYEIKVIYCRCDESNYVLGCHVERLILGTVKICKRTKNVTATPWNAMANNRKYFCLVKPQFSRSELALNCSRFFLPV